MSSFYEKRFFFIGLGGYAEWFKLNKTTIFWGVFPNSMLNEAATTE